MFLKKNPSPPRWSSPRGTCFFARSSRGGILRVFSLLAIYLVSSRIQRHCASYRRQALALVVSAARASCVGGRVCKCCSFFPPSTPRVMCIRRKQIPPPCLKFPPRFLVCIHTKINSLPGRNSDGITLPPWELQVHGNVCVWFDIWCT